MISSAHIIGGGALGGAELFYVRLIHALQARQQRVLSINIPGGQVSARLQADVAQIHVPMRGIWDLPSRWRISAIVREHQPDIVQTYMGRATRLTHLEPGRRPIHVARLGGYYDLKGYRHAHAWVGNTKGICDYLINNGLPATRIAHIGNFVDLPAASSPELLAEQRRRLHIPEEALILVAVGRLHPVKGFEDLLAALSTLGSTLDHRPLYLVIAGDGPLNARLRNYADQISVGERVRWVGWQLDPHPYYELADLFVCPSRHETLGNVILEAWAHGRAVLSTQTAGAAELVAQGEDAWLVPPQQPQALADGIRRLLTDEPLRQRLAANGRAKAESHYSQQHIVNAYLELYQRLLAE
ncbi:MAG: glycosyltransferase [Candidatus Competibacter sp.]|nr:glycosyltransferase [Candidatus Competibacter sp.]MDG4606793.1 glycosyltransferase [Candidatus Contendobacter sp.]HRD50129.1 glycosyltransferase [Candidatus Contendobacter sp.]